MKNRRLFLALVILILVPFWLPSALRLFGFYVDEPGWYVAKIAVENSKPISVCQQIITTPWNFLSPTTDDQRALCIFDYARLASDPSACELLMPSEYGLSCIGAAETRERTCTIAFNRIVEWGSYLNGTHQSATIDECRNGSITSDIGKKCCIVSKIANLRDFNDCSSLSGEKNVYEDCLSELALKLGNPAICDPIEGQSKTACILRAKYKSALSTLPPPLER